MSLSLVIPCYNEASRGDFAARVGEVLSLGYEAVFVDDGSTDDTPLILSRAGACVVRNMENRGKGYSLREGFRRACGDWVLMMDADLSVPLGYVGEFLSRMSDGKCLLASRDIEGAVRSGQGVVRQFIGRACRELVGRTLHLGVSDTQCGFKMLPRDAFLRVAEYMQCDRWMFDVELLAYLKALGVSLEEIPVRWEDGLPSTLHSFSAALGSFGELMGILRRYRSDAREIRGGT